MAVLSDLLFGDLEELGDLLVGVAQERSEVVGQQRAAGVRLGVRVGVGAGFLAAADRLGVGEHGPGEAAQRSLGGRSAIEFVSRAFSAKTIAIGRAR